MCIRDRLKGESRSICHLNDLSQNILKEPSPRKITGIATAMATRKPSTKRVRRPHPLQVLGKEDHSGPRRAGKNLICVAKPSIRPAIGMRFRKTKPQIKKAATMESLTLQLCTKVV